MQKRILLVVPRLNIGGAETYVYTMALALKEAGYLVYAASGGGALAKALERQGVRHFFLPIRLSTGLSAVLLERIVRVHQIDLIHANSAAAGIAAVKAAKRCQVPVVYTAHGVFGHNEKEMTLNACDRIVCVSEFVRRDAIKKGFAQAKLVTHYSGVDTSHFMPRPERKEMERQKWGIPADAFTIALVARVKNLQDKGHQEILDVLQTCEQAKDWHLLIVGTGRGMPKLKYQIARAQLGSRVHCTGHCLAVAQALAAADAAVLPSKFETFGLVLAEAMAMALPAVAYAVGGTPEVIADGKSGFLVRRGDLAALQQRLQLLKDDPAMRSAMGKQARQSIIERFSKEQMVDKMQKLYQDLLGEG